MLCEPRPVEDEAATGDRQRSARARRRARRLLLGAGLAAAPFVAAGVVGSLLVGPGGATGESQRLDTGPRSGPAPQFSLPSLADPSTQIALADFRGAPVAVNFWASWCAPCRREMPRLADAARRLEGRVAFLGVDYKDSAQDGLAFVAETGVPYPSVLDQDGGLGLRYGVYGIPTTVFIDSEGRIVGRYLGEMHGDTLDRLLAQLLDKSRR